MQAQSTHVAPTAQPRSHATRAPFTQRARYHEGGQQQFLNEVPQAARQNARSAAGNQPRCCQNSVRYCNRRGPRPEHSAYQRPRPWPTEPTQPQPWQWPQNAQPPHAAAQPYHAGPERSTQARPRDSLPPAYAMPAPLLQQQYQQQVDPQLYGGLQPVAPPQMVYQRPATAHFACPYQAAQPFVQQPAALEYVGPPQMVYQQPLPAQHYVSCPQCAVPEPYVYQQSGAPLQLPYQQPTVLEYAATCPQPAAPYVCTYPQQAAPQPVYYPGSAVNKPLSIQPAYFGTTTGYYRNGCWYNAQILPSSLQHQAEPLEPLQLVEYVVGQPDESSAQQVGLLMIAPPTNCNYQGYSNAKAKPRKHLMRTLHAKQGKSRQNLRRTQRIYVPGLQRIGEWLKHEFMLSTKSKVKPNNNMGNIDNMTNGLPQLQQQMANEDNPSVIQTMQFYNQRMLNQDCEAASISQQMVLPTVDACKSTRHSPCRRQYPTGQDYQGTSHRDHRVELTYERRAALPLPMQKAIYLAQPNAELGHVLATESPQQQPAEAEAVSLPGQPQLLEEAADPPLSREPSEDKYAQHEHTDTAACAVSVAKEQENHGPVAAQQSVAPGQTSAVAAQVKVWAQQKPVVAPAVAVSAVFSGYGNVLKNQNVDRRLQLSTWPGLPKPPAKEVHGQKLAKPMQRSAAVTNATAAVEPESHKVAVCQAESLEQQFRHKPLRIKQRTKWWKVSAAAEQEDVVRVEQQAEPVAEEALDSKLAAAKLETPKAADLAKATPMEPETSQTVKTETESEAAAAQAQDIIDLKSPKESKYKRMCKKSAESTVAAAGQRVVMPEPNVAEIEDTKVQQEASLPDAKPAAAPRQTEAAIVTQANVVQARNSTKSKTAKVAKYKRTWKKFSVWTAAAADCVKDSADSKLAEIAADKSKTSKVMEMDAKVTPYKRQTCVCAVAKTQAAGKPKLLPKAAASVRDQATGTKEQTKVAEPMTGGAIVTIVTKPKDDQAKSMDSPLEKQPTFKKLRCLPKRTKRATGIDRMLQAAPAKAEEAVEAFGNVQQQSRAKLKAKPCRQERKFLKMHARAAQQEQLPKAVAAEAKEAAEVPKAMPAPLVVQHEFMQADDNLELMPETIAQHALMELADKLEAPAQVSDEYTTRRCVLNLMKSNCTELLKESVRTGQSEQPGRQAEQQSEAGATKISSRFIQAIALAARKSVSKSPYKNSTLPFNQLRCLIEEHFSWCVAFDQTAPPFFTTNRANVFNVIRELELRQTFVQRAECIKKLLHHNINFDEDIIVTYRSVTNIKCRNNFRRQWEKSLKKMKAKM